MNTIRVSLQQEVGFRYTVFELSAANASMPKVPHSREHHGEARFIRCRDHLIIAD